MDLRQYFKKIKDTEEEIKEEYPLIVSAETPDGGKAGAVVEVSRQQAAKAIVENRAVLATEEQKIAHLALLEERKKSFEKADLARRLQFAIISDAEYRGATRKQEKGDEPKGSK